MTILDHLAKRHADRLATFETLAGWKDSLDSDERTLYARAKQSYEAARRAYSKAMAEEGAARG